VTLAIKPVSCARSSLSDSCGLGQTGAANDNVVILRSIPTGLGIVTAAHTLAAFTDGQGTPTVGVQGPQRLFADQSPGIADANDGNAQYELGMKFQAARDGVITAVRHYRSPGESGAHVGRIWDARGALLAQVSFQRESGSGWQEQALTTPLVIQANTVYVISVNSNGFFPIAHNVFDRPVVNGDLTGIADGNNGVFGASGSLPTNSFRNSNYFRDVVFVVGKVSTLRALSGDAQSGIVGSVLAQPLVVTLSDGGGSPVAGETIRFAVTTGGGSLSAASGVTNAQGEASTSLTLPTTSGTSSVTASTGSGGSVTFSATAIAGAPATLALTPPSVDATIGTPVRYQAIIADQHGNVVTNAGGRVSFAANNIAGAFLPAASVAVTNGVAAVDFTPSGAGSGTIAATYAGVPNASGIIQMKSGSLLKFRGDGQTGIPGSALAAPFVVKAVDSAGNPVSGVKVTFALTKGEGSLSPSTKVTAANGRASSRLTLGQTEGPRIVQASAAGYGAVQFNANTSASSNTIVIENQNQGSSGWRMTNPVSESNPEIMGYASATSVNRGNAIDFKISLAQAGNYTIEVYRLGFYRGTGGRLLHSSGTQSGRAQPACRITNAATRLIECSWSTSYTLQVGSNWTSGFYVAKLTRSGSGRESQIWFVVRDDSSRSDILFQSSFTTFLAYSNFGSVERHSLYEFNSTSRQRALKVSFDRPFGQVTTDQGRYDNVFDYEHSMIRWMESQGYDISYVTNLDVHGNPNQLSNHRVFLSVGHDEYWSEEMRNAVERARDRGVNLGFFSANTAFWRVRLESASNGSANRVMACYKDPQVPDPVAPTYLWRGPQNRRPENALLGIMYTGDDSLDRYGGAAFVVSNSSDPYFAHTGLRNGDKLPGLIGFEWDSLVPNGQAPSGLVVLGRSPVRPTNLSPELPPGTDTGLSHVVRYTAGSGAKVFSTGSIQFIWVLDDSVVPGWAPRKMDARGKQFVVNALLDMGARPATPDAQVVLP
jgi:hypothetical protein